VSELFNLTGSRIVREPTATDDEVPSGEARPSLSPSGPRSWWTDRGAMAEVLVVTCIALAVRLVFLDHTPHEDEINHVLAARSLIADGSLAIGDGPPYTRAWLYTYLIAGMISLLGDSLVVARLPAVAFGSLLVTTLFLWVRAEAGRTGAWIAALLLVFSPVGIEQSQWVRFYTLHALMVCVAAIATYRLLSPRTLPRSETMFWAAVASGAILLALHLQITTAVALAGLLVWAGMVLVHRHLHRLRDRRTQVLLATASILAAVTLVLLLVPTGLAAALLERLQFAEPWAEANRHNWRFYHFMLLDQYPALWTTFPLALLAGLAFRPRAALLCACLFGFALGFHSAVAWKVERYIFYALPFFFALWGIAIQAVLPWLREQVGMLLATVRRGAAEPRLARAATYAFLIGFALFAAAGSGAASYSYKMLTVPDAEWEWFVVAPYRGWPDWQAAAQELEPLSREVDVLLASSEINALWALGRVDLILRRSARSHGILPEFARWWKVPVPVISTAESLELVMACHASGLILIERNHWRNDWGVPLPTADFIVEALDRHPLPERFRLMAFTWAHPQGWAPDRCPAGRASER